jgi:multiple sugar transport system substrate-binding protein
MNLTKPQLIFLGVIGLIIVIFGLVFTCVLPGRSSCKTTGPKIKAELQFWGPLYAREAYGKAIDSFSAAYPDIKVNYRSFATVEEYDSVLLDSLAAGTGPDIFMIPSSGLPKNINKIQPIPQTNLNVATLRQYFPETVERDFVSQNTIYALPIAIDTLALYYNRDIFSQNGIAGPPATWEDFKNDVLKLTKFDKAGKITQAAAAIGSAKNIDRYFDILATLMLQTGTKMTSPDSSSATFYSQEGTNALDFYTQFANQTGKFYTWNDSLPNYLDAFSGGTVAMIFDYSSALSAIKTKSPFLNFALAPMPHTTNQFTYPSYWGYVVSRQSKYPSVAWDFILGLTTKPENVKAYSKVTKEPPAITSLIGDYATDPEMSVFANQTLTARSWPQAEPKFFRQVFGDMIESVLAGQVGPGEALKQAQDKINQTTGR